MDEVDFGDLCFSLFVSYIGALEFLLILRQLVHWSGRHQETTAVEENDAQQLEQMKEKLRQALEKAKAMEEAHANDKVKVMQDGVAYKDGFRIEPNQQEIDELKAKIFNIEKRIKRQKELEAELARQRKIRDETKKQIERAEAELEEKRKKEQQQQKSEESENYRQLLEAEKQRKEEQEQKENERKILEAERQREIEQRQREEEQEKMQAQRQREAEQKQREAEEEAENQRKILEAEQQREAKQERIENERKILAVERERELQKKQREAAAEEEGKNPRKSNLSQRLIESENTRLSYEHDEEEAEEVAGDESENSAFLRPKRAGRKERKQRQIEENARKFVEAEQEMVQKILQQQQSPIPEPILSARTFNTNEATPPSPVTPTVKTQFGQATNEAFSRVSTTKPLLFPGISDDASSNEPYSSKQSSFSTQPSEEIMTGNEETTTTQPHTRGVIKITTTTTTLGLLERQAPDGSEESPIHQQYDEEYLRSLDGIKYRPLTREDGTGRRRAFKKRRSSGSSNSSRDSRTSREEELKMFTSLEEEEFKQTGGGGSGGDGESDFTPIRYSSNEPLAAISPSTLKVKSGHHRHRRHKRSPAKDDSLRKSLEMLGEEESTNPWGEVVPEHYKNTEFWRREKAISIDEEEIELELPTGKGEEGSTNIENEVENANQKANSSSFEEATIEQNEQAITAMFASHSVSKAGGTAATKDEDTLATLPQNEEGAISGGDSGSGAKLADDSDCTNLQLNSQKKESRSNSPARSTDSSPRLRRSPRIEEIDHYEERWQNAEISRNNQAQATTMPKVNIQPPTQTNQDNGPWRDEFGLLMQGLSDFYDFQASANPSRSRDSSRQTSPVRSQPNSPLLRDVEYNFERETGNEHEIVFDVYDDMLTNEGGLEFGRKYSLKFDFYDDTAAVNYQSSGGFIVKHVADVDDANGLAEVPEIFIEEAAVAATAIVKNESLEAKEMSALVQSLRNERIRSSHSRSRSPLPTSGNLERSLEARRTKLIKHNDELFEKMNSKSKTNEETEARREETGEPRVETETETAPPHDNNKESLKQFPAKCCLEPETAPRRRGRSRSRSPLPTMDNIQRSLETRRNKLIQHNDEVAENLKIKIELTTENTEKNRLEVAPENEIKAKEVKCLVENSKALTIDEENRQTTSERDKMNDLVASLRVAQQRSRSRSRSPVPPTMANMQRSIASRRQKRIQHNDDVQRELSQQHSHEQHSQVTITVEEAVEEQRDFDEKKNEAEEIQTGFFKDKEMSALVATLRAARSRSRSPIPALMKRSSDNDDDESKPQIIVEYVLGNEPSNDDDVELRHKRSRTPSRSQSPRAIGDRDNCDRDQLSYDALAVAAEKQHHLDLFALDTLKNAAEETELSMFNAEEYMGAEANDQLDSLPIKTQLKKLRCTPTTPNYERTLSDEWRDVQRTKNEILAGKFKRSTYVGESLELGSEYENLRRQTAHFRRSKSPTPYYNEDFSVNEAKMKGEEKIRIQQDILADLISKSAQKTQEFTEVQGAHILVEVERFERSRCRSRSPVVTKDAQVARELAAIDAEAAKREMQDRILDSLSNNATLSFQNFQDISRHLNADFLEDRRASDSAMVGRDNGGSGYEFEPDDYHHFRRFSLYQEQPVEQYPDDDDDVEVYVDHYELEEKSADYIYVTEMGQLRREHNEALYPTEDDDDDGSEDERQTVVEVDDDEIDTDICDFNERGPTDESHHEQSECEEAERAMDHYAGREAADWRELDEEEVSDVSEMFNIKNQDMHHDDGVVEEDEAEEGACGGGLADSYNIDQIYDEAIKNRKQSGILREFDSILYEMQKSYEKNSEARKQLKHEDIDDDAQAHYELWAKTRSRKKSLTVSFIEAEKRDSEMRYLGDATMTARQATRLRSRYGYVPKLQSSADDLNVNVDLNYRPKREYNWRKNFKLDEEENFRDEAMETMKRNFMGEHERECNDNEDFVSFDERKFSLGGESITLYSRSPERELFYAEMAEIENFKLEESNGAPLVAATTTSTKKLKKKKSKKKSKAKNQIDQDGNKANCEDDDDDDDEENIDFERRSNRRSSSIQIMDSIIESPKRKSRSRRSSRSSVTTTDETFSPQLVEVAHQSETNQAPTTKKTLKKRKKLVKQNYAKSSPENIKEEIEEIASKMAAPTTPPPAVSATLTPTSLSLNMLATLSPQQSVCITPASTDSEKSLKCSTRKTTSMTSTTTATSSSTTTTSTPTITSSNSSSTSTPTQRQALPSTTSSSSLSRSSAPDSFNMLKDANFYPLF